LRPDGDHAHPQTHSPGIRAWAHSHGEFHPFDRHSDHPAVPSHRPHKTTDDGDSDPVDGLAGTPDDVVVVEGLTAWRAPTGRGIFLQRRDADAGPRRRQLQLTFVPRPPPASLPL
jgi:hypothetical protein